MSSKFSILVILAMLFSSQQCFLMKSELKGRRNMNYGRSSINELCPPRMKLNCANVMYSKQCNYNYDCSYVAPRMLCCQTGCTGNSKFMCVPEENPRCPYLQPAYYTGMKKCRTEIDCGQGFICCLNIAGEGYCHKPSTLN